MSSMRFSLAGFGAGKRSGGAARAGVPMVHHLSIGGQPLAVKRGTGQPPDISPTSHRLFTLQQVKTPKQLHVLV